MQVAEAISGVEQVTEAGPNQAFREPVSLSGWAAIAARVAFAAFILLALEELLRTNHALDWSYLTTDTPSWPRHEQVAKGLAQLRLSSSFPAWWFLTITYVQAVASFSIAGFLVLRRPAQPIALLTGAFLVSATVATYPGDLNTLAQTHPWEAFLGAVVTFPFPAGLVTLAFVFPDGRFVPRWTAVPVVLVLAGLAFTMFPYPRELSIGGQAGDTAQLAAVFILAAGSQAYRFRHNADEPTRQQMRLFMVGFGMLMAAFVLFNVAIDLGNLDRANFSPTWAVLFTIGIGTTLSLATLLLAGLLTASVLRYRLFDIEIILNRTFVLVCLTAAVAFIYVAAVGGAQFAFSGAANGVIALAAAAIVALAFQPIRIGLQRAANRLLYGERGEPYSALSELNRRLESAITSTSVLQEIVIAVRGTLKLPYVAIRLTDGTDMTAESGKPAPTALRLPLTHRGERLGELEVAQWPGTALTMRDRDLLTDLARHAGAAISAAKLTVDLMRARERLVNAREEERRRLRRDLHDGLGPRLASMILRIDTVRDRLDPDSQADQMLFELAERVGEAIKDVRRLVNGLRPPALDELGLIEALRQSFAGSVERGLALQVEPAALAPLPAAVEVAAFRIAQEALTNTIRHSSATECRILFEQLSNALHMLVTDNGRGINGSFAEGVGLTSMRERAEELGGILIVSPGEGGGTLIRAVLPCVAPPQGATA